jgi:hypothetical protein
MPLPTRPRPLPADLLRRRLLLAATASPTLPLLAACGTTGSAGSGPPAPAPDWRIGDRWTYDAADGFRQPVTWTETREVIGSGADGFQLRVTQKGPTVDSTRIEQWPTPGSLRVGAVFDNEMRTFTPPLPRFDFPLAPGQRWSLFADNVNATTGRSGQINYFVRVSGWDRTTAGGTTYDTLALRLLIRLDDEEFWRNATECNHLFHYAPSIGGTVLEERDAQYLERGDARSAIPIRSQHAQLTLTEFRRG